MFSTSSLWELEHLVSRDENDVIEVLIGGWEKVWKMFCGDANLDLREERFWSKFLTNGHTSQRVFL